MQEIHSGQVIWAVLWAALFGVCGFAILKGRTPERLGAVLFLLVALAGEAMDAIFAPDVAAVASLLADGVVALGFLALSIRYASLWLGGAMLCTASQFSLHAYYFVTERDEDYLHAVFNNVNAILMLFLLLFATVLSIRRSAGPSKRLQGS